MKKLLLVFFVVAFLIATPALQVVADTYGDLEHEINDLKAKIDVAQTKERTLNSEITAMDNTIKLTTLQITETEQKIVDLGEEIDKLTVKITSLEVALSRMSELLINRIVTAYKLNRVSYVTVLFQANGLTDFLNRAKYIQLAQEHDRQMMTSVQMTKVDFSEQKQLREVKKAQQEDLKFQLEVQKNKLNEQKKTKQALLTQTRNDETTYQKLLQQALAEKQALEAAIVSGVQVGPVKKGDPIALVGNTGYPACSTGAHLHFEVHKNDTWVNPSDYLKSKTVKDDQNGGSWTVGSGDWEWPLEGDIRVTQHYGSTPYSWRYAYSGGIHTGFDMVSDSSSVIRAPKDGTLYTSSQNCGGSSIIKIKYIDHGDGVMSFYLHVQ